MAAIDHLDETYATLQVGSKVWKAFTVLGLGTDAGAVDQSRLEQFSLTLGEG